MARYEAFKHYWYLYSETPLNRAPYMLYSPLSNVACGSKSTYYYIDSP